MTRGERRSGDAAEKSENRNQKPEENPKCEEENSK
jgi:hypothetical protein